MVLKKEIILISFLLNKCTWATSGELAECLDLSPRSVYSYIARINAEYDNIILSSNKGYIIQKEKAVQILNSIPNSWIPSNVEERRKYILQKILFAQQNPSLDYLLDKLCISYPTLMNEVSRLRNYLSEYSLHLRIKDEKLSIIGIEKDKRRFILKLVNEELERSSFSLEKIQEFFLNVDLKKIKKIIINSLKKNGYFLDEYSLINYILHIAVFLERQENNKITTNNPTSQKAKIKEIVSAHVFHIIVDIYNQLKENFDIDFSQEDFLDVSLPMMTNAFSGRIDQLELDQLGDFVGQDIVDLLFEIVRAVRDTYSIDLKEGNFLIRFAFHLKNVIVRVKNNITIKNSQLIKIKSGFPLIYVIAVFISNIINNRINDKLSEDEIAYIALHIGALIEEKKAYVDKLKCVVLAPEFHSPNRELYKRLNNSFSENLIVTKLITSYDDIPDFNSFDLLLSTITINPLEIDPGLLPAYLQIDPFLSELTVKNLHQKIDDIKQLKKKQKILEQFKVFFRKDLFFVDYPFRTHIDVIEKICDYMIEKKYVDANYKKEVYEHEEVAASSYGNIAIPHPLTNKAISSVIAVSINPTPVDWLGNKVNVVFMLSLEEKNQGLFKEIFDSIAHLIARNETFDRIVNIKTYEEFIDLFVQFASD